MKRILTSALFVLGITSTAFALETATPSSENVELVAQGTSNGSMQPGCQSLPADQQNFALQLSPSNKAMFCNKFSMDQRKSAMQMMGTTGSNGSMMNADQAVEQVAKNNNMMAPSKTPMKSGGCPVRSQ